MFEEQLLGHKCGKETLFPVAWGFELEVIHLETENGLVFIFTITHIL